MGITIHYAGTAASEKSIEAFFDEAIEIAKQLRWKANVPELAERRGEGIVFLPHADCEPLSIRFTRTRRFSDYCKTQFAGPTVHRQVLQFFSLLANHFSKLVIYDESEDFECDEGEERLERVFEISTEYICQVLKENPGAKLRVHLPNGRIADLVN